ncbi:diguanylate cyclase (GGDEF) domain-containing protein [Pseudomonas flavescens]|uniref:diguanylate cyclase n=1 Tax=Phytopseudomonas flavescens TaxID=29435 RepID=A0A1G8AY48_9GAMM|nr:sensor domain-containing diguanylate cyclase [Pseudomonas flavescens]SDH25736.1 diguanylate cyclase (GGDEF) domain-containing protein [Pseudomonas flavescens]
MIRIDLRQLILSLTLLSVAATLANALYSSYRVQEDLLVSTTLEANRVYATKLAASTDRFLAATQQRLAFASGEIKQQLDQPAALQLMTKRLLLETSSFNSVLIVDADGRVVGCSPESLHLGGTLLRSEGNSAALRERQPLISQPFMSTTGKLVVTVSQPLFDVSGRYRGYLSGVIYLQCDSILHSLLGEHYYRDGSYLYVVDSQRRLIYHRDVARLGSTVNDNPAIEQVIAGQEGSMQLRNSQGVDMLVGYAPLQSAGWGVVAQRPLAATLAQLDGLLWRTVANILPMLLLSLLLIWWLARRIALPLWQMARNAREMESPGARETLEQVSAWYFEAAQLKQSLLAGLSRVNSKIHRLNHESLTDQLTGLCNRRGMESVLGEWTAAGRRIAVIVLDIDHFKQVNDAHGHDMGDRILQELAHVMRACARAEDLLCRSGGEEFAIFLPDDGLDSALEVAERLRRAVAEYPFASDGQITISLGLAHFPDSAALMDDVLKQADRALYQAKAEGRNRSVVARVD